MRIPKYIPVLLFLLAAAPILVRAQHSCCVVQGGPAAFAQLGKEEDFRKAHLPPAPLQYTGKGKQISYKTPDGALAHAYMVRARQLTTKCLFVFHEWWGLNAHIRKEADKLYEDLDGKVNVYALDLYDGLVASTPDSAGTLMRGLKEERARAIVSGLIAHVGTNAEIATIGWCMGGGWSMQAALMMGAQNRVCVLYYGMPEMDVAKLKKLPGGVVGLFANRDKWITPEVVKEFTQHLKEAGKIDDAIIMSYDADHAFANPSNPEKFNKAATEGAYPKALFAIKRYLLKEM